MGTFRFQVAVSLDGYVAGPQQSLENPLGVGGEELHRWLFDLEVWRTSEGEGGGEVNASTPVMEEVASEHRRGRDGPEHVRGRAGTVAGGPTMEGLVGRRSALPRPHLRPHASPA